jgi:hypothetical protein
MTPTRRRLTVAASLVAFCVGLSAQTYPPAFPRPTAKKLFETDSIVVWDIVWPKDYATPLHRHLYDQVGTYYATGGRIITSPEGEKRSSTTPVGALSTTRRGTTHIEQGATDPPLRAVFIEMKRDTGSGQPEAAAATAPPWIRDGAKTLLDDERVVVWDYTWKPGAPAPATYTRDTVVVWLSGGKVRLTPRGAAAQVVNVVPGRTDRYNRGASETVEVVDGNPRAMIFAFK